jgi:phage terminase small subunit
LGDALSTMYEAIDGIKLSGLVINSGTIPKANPYVKIKNDAKLEAFKIMKQFGLNPLDRKKLEKGEIEEEESELDKLIGEML